MDVVNFKLALLQFRECYWWNEFIKSLMVILYVIESHIILQLGSDSVLFSCFSSRAALDPVHPIYTVCYHTNFIHIEKKPGLFIPCPKIKCEESLNKGITLDVFMNLYSIVFDNIKGVTNTRHIFLSRLLSYKGIFLAC